MGGLRDGAIALLGLALLFPIQSTIDTHRGEPPDLVTTMPPQRLLPVLAFGHRESAADLFEIQVTNFLGRRMTSFSRFDRDQLWQMYSGIRALDPQNADAAWRGAVYLSAVADRPDSAIQMLGEAIGELEGPPWRPPIHPRHPKRWLLYHEMAATHFLMLRKRTDDPQEKARHARRAGELWMLAADLPGSQEWFLDMGRRLTGEGLSAVESARHEVLLWQNRSEVGDESQRAIAAQRLREASSAMRREELQERVEALRQEGRTVTHLAQLGVRCEDPRTLKDVDPLGVGFILREGRVVAPGYEASKMQRRLIGPYESFRARNPGKAPTLSELGLPQALPEFLEARITAETLEVVGRIP